MLDQLRVSPRCLEDLEARIRRAYAPRPRRRRLGSTPVDIETLLRAEDEAPYFAQLHYREQYDARGYPQMRVEFLDYLEAALDAQRTRNHLRRMRRLAWIAAACRACAAQHPAAFALYSMIVLDGRSVALVADDAEVRPVRLLRLVDQARRAIEGAYQRCAEGDLAGVLADTQRK